MNYRSTYILFGLVALVLILLGVALYRTPGSEPSKFVLPVLQDKANPVSQADITRIEIEHGSEKINLTRQGTTWKVNQFRASDLAVNQLLSQLFDAQREKVDKPANLSDWGLAPPTGVVKLFRADESQVAQLDVGKTGPGGSLYVLDASRSDEPMAVRKASLESVLNSVNAFRDRTLLGSSPSSMTRIELTEGDKKLALQESGGTWRFVPPTPFSGLASNEVTERRTEKGAPRSVPNLQHDLANLQPGPETAANDFVADNVKPEDFTKYFLDPTKNKILTIKVTRQGEADPVELLIGIEKPADDKGEKYYARLTSEPNVMRVPAKEVKALLALLENPQALRDYHLVRLSPGQTFDAIQIELLTLPKPNVLEFFLPEPRGNLAKTGGWQFFLGDQAQSLDENYLRGLIDLLTQDKMVVSFPPDDKGSGLDKPQVVVKLYTGAVTAPAAPGQKPGLKPDAKPIILSFAAPETPLAWARREQGGETTNMRVKAVVRERVGEGPLAYRSKELPHYKDPNDTKAFESKVSILRNGVVTTLARDKAEASWKFVAPEKLAPYPVNASVVQFLLQDLNTLRADKLVAEKADASTLKEYGLADPPVIRVTVTVTGADGKTSDHVYDFGKDTADGTQVSGKQGERDLVFNVSKARLAPLNAELRDTTIFTIKPEQMEKVNRLELVIGGARPIHVNLERKDGKWIDKDVATAVPDPEKIKGLVSRVLGLRATRFLPDAADPAKYGLESKAGALEINVFVEGEDKPFSLTVGRAEGEDAYAVSNQLPKDKDKPRELFLVPKYIFDGDEKGPTLRNPSFLFRAQ